MATAVKSSEMAPWFDHQYNNSSAFSNSSGLTWADQWDCNDDFGSDGSAKSKSKLEDYNKKMKSVAVTGFGKAKSAASTGAKKAKAGTSAGVRWIKIQYSKRRNHSSQHDQTSDFKYSI